MRRILKVALVLAALFATAAPARADVYDDNPSAAAVGPGNIWLFARAADGTVLARHGDGKTWGDWASLGGVATSGPAAVVYNGQVQVYVRGADGAIWENGLGSSGWGNWTSLGGYSTSAPSLSVRRSLGYLDLAYRGADNAIWFRSYVPGTGWSAPSSIAGNLSSAPTVVSYVDNNVHVFARGTDQAIAVRYWNGSAWGDWAAFGGVASSAPEAISRSPSLLNVYVRGGTATYTNVFNGSAWSNWQLLDSTAIDSAPVPFSDDPGHESLLARQGKDLLLKSWTSSTGWGAWVDLGAIAVPAPAAPPAPTPAPAPLGGEVDIQAGIQCTPAGGRARVSITIHKKKGAARPIVKKIVFFTKGKGRAVQVDSKAPFVVHIKVNKPAGLTGRVYARVYFRRSKHGPLHRKLVSKRYSVCR